MRNARIWVSNRHPGAPTLEAGKRVARFPNKDKPGEWIMHTLAEDLFGVFDLMVFPRLKQLGIDCIQVTTITDGKLSAVAARKAKVGQHIRDTYYSGEKPAWLGDVFIIGWVSRKHFRIWRWSWVRTDATHWGRWDEQDPETAKPAKQAAAARGDARTALATPFD